MTTAFKMMFCFAFVFLIGLPYLVEASCPSKPWKGCTCEPEPAPNITCTGTAVATVIPETMTSDLIGLTIHRCNLKRIQTMKYRDLITMDLAHNNISDVQVKAFQNQAKLRFLVLRNNSIHDIHKDAFFGLTNLNHLDLSMNRIEYITEKHPFSGLPALKCLSLRKNLISEVLVDSFQDLHYLEDLDLSYNLIQTLHSNIFFGLNRLKRLDLSGNQLHMLQQSPFKRLPGLLELSVSENKITAFTIETFTGLSKLQKLYADYNRLYTVEAKSFEPFYSSLKYISLSNNSIETLVPNLLPWNTLTYVNFNNNPVICDCHMRWMIHQEVHISQMLKNVRCAKPDANAGKQITNIEPENFICDSKPKYHEVSLIVGFSITFFVFVAFFFIVALVNKGKCPCQNDGLKRVNYIRGNKKREGRVPISYNETHDEHDEII